MQESIASQQRLTIELMTPDDSDLPVYLTGNFNDWTVADETYRMTKTGRGRYEFSFSPQAQLPDVIEYKFLRGTWENEELDAYGNIRQNRQVNPNSVRIAEHVPRWRKQGLAYNPDFLPKISVIDEVFEFPQLIKTRRIAALLPHNYYDTDRHYPVLYLQDGQNLFDDYAPFGNWAVDKKLALMAEKGQGDIIIVSIDHAESERIEEFTPSMKTRLGRGDGKKYARFLSDTLKPFIDRNFRTLPDRDHTGIGGSSMGGLISIYAGLMYPEVYSRLMIFSPSLWVAPNIYSEATTFDQPFATRIYLYGGGREGANVVPNMERFIGAIKKQGLSNNVQFNMAIDPKGQHNEVRWGEEFPKAVEWLFFH